MKIGIKYCGGCNPRYRRKEMVNQLKEALAVHIDFERASENSMYDLLLVLGGCSNCCTDYSSYTTRRGVIKISNESDYENVLHHLIYLKDYERKDVIHDCTRSL